MRKYSTPNTERNYFNYIAFQAQIQTAKLNFNTFRWPETVELDADLEDDLDELEVETDDVEGDTLSPEPEYIEDTSKILAKKFFEANETMNKKHQASKLENRTEVSSTDGQASVVAGEDKNGSLQDLEVGTSSDVSDCDSEESPEEPRVQNPPETPTLANFADKLNVNEKRENIKQDIKANNYGLE